MTDPVLWIALSRVPDLGPVTFRRCLDRFGSVEALFGASSESLRSLEGMKPAIVSKLLDPSLVKSAREELKRVRSEGIEVVGFSDEGYPSLLKEIYDPPIMLYWKGQIPNPDSSKLAVVGSRASSEYGERMAKRFSSEFCRAGLTVVSGMALGIDTAAHEGALAAGGSTLAVLGCGLLKVYPACNAKLAEKITRSGALISEYPIDEPARPVYFPRRNRIISGLSKAIIVVEAKEKSGALITADCALDQGRDVYALPGNADSARSRGTNLLIRQGARIALDPEDVLSDFGFKVQATKNDPERVTGLGDEETVIFKAFDRGEAVHFDELVVRTGYPPARASSTLTRLELKGLVQAQKGNYYLRK